MTESATARGGRPKLAPEDRAPTRPTLAGRVSQALYDRVAEAAQRSGRKLSEEATWRIEQSFEYEKQYASAEEILDNAVKLAAESAKNRILDQMRAAGFTCVVGATGGRAWFEPGVDPDSVTWVFDNDANRAVVEELVARAASAAVSRVRASMEDTLRRAIAEAAAKAGDSKTTGEEL